MTPSDPVPLDRALVIPRLVQYDKSLSLQPVKKIPSDGCRCGDEGKQTCNHLFSGCEAWAPRRKEPWKSAGKASGWKHPRVPTARTLSTEEKGHPSDPGLPVGNPR